MNSIIGIYKITSPSGRVYIGQSWNIKQRWYTYRGSQCKSQPKLDSSFSKYGARNHHYEILHELPPDVEQSVMDEYEKLYMDSYRECGARLLNLRGGGEGGRLSEETRKKIGLKSKGHPPNSTSFKKGHKQIRGDEWKKKVSIANTGKRHSDEAKAKIKAKRKAQVISHSQEKRNKISLSNKGKKLQPEQIKALIRRHTGNKYNVGKRHTQATKDQISKKKTGVKYSEEIKKKHSETMKLWWAKRKGLS